MLCAAAAAQQKAQARETVNYRGTQGLNIIPSARMDDPGTMRIGVSHTDPHNHAFIGFQIAKPLYVNLRQSMYVSSVGERPDYVYPGMDIKLRLREEGRYAPAIVFGMDSALGNKRFSSEYFALSKRVHDFDLTAGIAWGRLGSSGHIKNPFAAFSSHFGRERDYSSHSAAAPADWFTGKEIGFFGGVEYHTPLNGLSLQADFNADAYRAETRRQGFSEPSPWSVGFNYSPREWVSVGASVIGMDKVMARITFQGKPSGWTALKSYKDREAPVTFNVRAARTNLGAALKDGRKQRIHLGDMREDGTSVTAVLHLNEYQPSAMQIGRAARHIANYAGPHVERLTVIPTSSGTRGKAVSFNRRDLERAGRNLGSPEEIWRNVSFGDGGLSISQKAGTRKYAFHPELSLSIGEEDAAHLYRASLLFEESKKWGHGFRSGTSLRLNLSDNLHRLEKYRGINPNSARGDAEAFAQNRFTVNRSYLSWMRTVLPELHVAASGGYLEEFYAGFGSEILYRPHKSPFSAGIEGWKLFKRDGKSEMALDLSGHTATTGHLNLYYDIPGTDITAFAKAGRFIGGDRGVSAGARMQFVNGMKAKAYITATDHDEKNVFGGDRNLAAGLRLAVPLGNLRFIPEGSEARLNVGPLGRNSGALLDKPLSLYDITEPMSYRRLGRSWQEVLN